MKARQFTFLNILFINQILFFTFSFSQSFSNVAGSVGLNPVFMPGTGSNGIAVADYNKDGHPDIYIVSRLSFLVNDKRTWNLLYKNMGDGTFSDVTTSDIAGRDANIEQSYLGSKFGASWGDFDNDGYPDLFLTHAGPNQLLHNNGNGTFKDITSHDSLGGGATQVSTSALWFDYDLDGDLDLYVGVWEDYSGDDATRDIKNQMYENIGNGRFIDVSEISGLADAGKTWMSVALDANNDGKPDLYLANDFGANKLYINNGNKTFSNKASEYGVLDYLEGMGLAIADCDYNGFFDLYLTNRTDDESSTLINPLFLNTGNKFYLNNSLNAGVSHADWGWGTEFFDYDNDSDEDLFVVNGYIADGDKNHFFENISEDTLKFNEISESLNLADNDAARGLVIYDFNDDGAQDILISNFNTRPFLYQNNTTSGNWLKIKLEGTLSNRNGFGSTVVVKTGNKIYYKYYHGAQYLGQNIVPLHIGLGSAVVIDSLNIIWPGGGRDTFNFIQSNRLITIKENTGIINSLKPVNLFITNRSIRLSGNYPNPFNGATNIKFELLKPGRIKLKIFNSTGQIIGTINEEYSSPGEKYIHWNLLNRNPDSATGLYFYSISFGNEFQQGGKMLYIK